MPTRSVIILMNEQLGEERMHKVAKIVAQRENKDMGDEETETNQNNRKRSHKTKRMITVLEHTWQT